MERHPVIVVGAGPAGTSAALHLHRSDPGLAAQALILEKAQHPRPKVCAGGLIPAALRCLGDLGVPFAVPHVTVRRARVFTPARTLDEEDGDLCYVVRRDEFDASLVDACVRRGLRVRQDEGVVDVWRDERGVCLRTERGLYHARVVVAADGSGSLVRRRLLGADKEQIARAVMCDVPIPDTGWDGFAAQRYEFDFRDLANGLRGYRWAFPCWIDGWPHVNVGAYSLTPAGQRLDRSLDELLGSLTGRAVRRRAFPIRWYRPRTRIAAPHVLLAGDAAGVDPLMGEGISLALEYGSFVGEAVRRALRTGDFSGADYQAAVEASWLGRKLRLLHLATRLFYGPTWKLWFAAAERSRRLRRLGLRWYNGVDEWDRRSGWSAVRALAGRADGPGERSPTAVP